MIFIAIPMLLYSIYKWKNKKWEYIRKVVAFFLLAEAAWLPDKFLCKQTTEFFINLIGFYPQLHAVWHVVIVLDLWYAITLVFSVRITGEKKESYYFTDGCLNIVPSVDIL